MIQAYDMGTLPQNPSAGEVARLPAEVILVETLRLGGENAVSVWVVEPVEPELPQSCDTSLIYTYCNTVMSTRR